MAVVRTPRMALITANDDEALGVGPLSDELVDDIFNTGLNGVFERLDEGIGLEHNPDGTHKAAIIRGVNLVQIDPNSTVDGTTVEFSANKARIKALGVGSSQIGNDAITGPKVAHDEKIRRAPFIFHVNKPASSSAWGYSQNVQFNLSLGQAIYSAGSVVRLTVCSTGDGSTGDATLAYASSGAAHFGLKDKLQIFYDFPTTTIKVQKNNVATGLSLNISTFPTAAFVLVTIEFEFDD